MEYVLSILAVGFALYAALWLFLRKRGIRMRIRGFGGRARIKSALGKTRKNKRYIINDLIIKTDDNGTLRTSRIDHIVINERGVFVIDAKDYSGNIYGKESDVEWTQVYNFGKSIHKLYNPVMKNRAHLYIVNSVLPSELSEVPLTSAVVFAGGKIKGINSSDVYTVRGMKKLFKKGERILSCEQMQLIYDSLIKVNGISVKLLDREENLRRMKAYIPLGICPSCDIELQLRQGRYGEFLACPNYPKCTFTKKI